MRRVRFVELTVGQVNVEWQAIFALIGVALAIFPWLRDLAAEHPEYGPARIVQFWLSLTALAWVYGALCGIFVWPFGAERKPVPAYLAVNLLCGWLVAVGPTMCSVSVMAILRELRGLY